ncbi:hypothetical protein JR316_0012884 [Psilocybe cubensis]|uniref:Uncharacterized protein n=2 Tax=Psilocybe cubensis TaxID=181762 RepID=A0ACB8GH94_PSICU|nr:hypothetical protein JR316_0012884 [Psilocybe cubensis]KAH9474425.1 hypothetical protein JR316_0012884 [Psilocybe cubensis]
MTDSPPDYIQSLTIPIYAPANEPLNPKTLTRMQMQGSHNAHKYMRGYQIPPLERTTVRSSTRIAATTYRWEGEEENSAHSATHLPLPMDPIIERVGFWLFFLFTVWLFGFSMCVLILTTAELALIPILFLQFTQMILTIDLPLASLPLPMSILSALFFCSFLLTQLHECLPSILASELNARYSIWHHTRRDMPLALTFVGLISMYAVFSHGLALLIVDSDKTFWGARDVEGGGVLGVMLQGARGTVGCCVLVGMALVLWHWRCVKIQAERARGCSEARLEQYSY